MLADPAVFMDSPPRPRHTAVGWALGFSALLHLLLVILFDPLSGWQPRRWSVAPIFPTLELQLRQAAPVARAIEAAPEADSVEPQTARPEVVTVEPIVAAPPAGASSLRLDLPDILDLVEESAPQEGITDNGAVVMRPELLSLLQDAERRSGHIAGAEGGEGAEFEGGQWVEYVRSGDRCFRVVRADPLEPGSHDMWYVIRCR